MCFPNRDEFSVEVVMGNSRIEAYVHPRRDRTYRMYVVVLSSINQCRKSIEALDWRSLLRLPSTIQFETCREASSRDVGARFTLGLDSRDAAFFALAAVSHELRQANGCV